MAQSFDEDDRGTKRSPKKDKIPAGILEPIRNMKPPLYSRHG